MNIAARPKRVCTGYQFVEGPVWIEADCPLLRTAASESRGLLFSDIPASRLYRLVDGRSEIVREPTGQANGNALDPDGMLVSCEHEHRRVSRFEWKGVPRSVVDRYQGRRLNSPNDVAVRSDGMIFFTDPPYGVADELRELDFQGVYRVEPDSGEAVLLVDDFDKPNGLAFSGDQSLLYVADTEKGHLRRFAVAADGRLAGDELFCECERPDGICIDTNGNVWVACMAGIEVFGADGQQIEVIPLPERPANMAFGGEDLSRLYICARTSIYTLETDVTGVALPPAQGSA